MFKYDYNQVGNYTAGLATNNCNAHSTIEASSALQQLFCRPPTLGLTRSSAQPPPVLAAALSQFFSDIFSNARKRFSLRVFYALQGSSAPPRCRGRLFKCLNPSPKIQCWWVFSLFLISLLGRTSNQLLYIDQKIMKSDYECLLGMFHNFTHCWKRGFLEPVMLYNSYVQRHYLIVA